MGKASTHWLAGLVYQSLKSLDSVDCASLNPNRELIDKVPATFEAVTRKRRRVNLPIGKVLSQKKRSH
jgi:hypothetical protein